MKLRKIVLLCSLLCIIPSGFAQQFIHPGLLHSEQSLERIKRLVDHKVQPAYGSYEILTKLPEARADYLMQGPFEIISRDGKYSYTKNPSERDFNSAYYNALLWQITGNKAHADKSMEIIRAYAASLRQIPPTNDAPLCAGLQGFMLVNAAEIMRYTYRKTQYSGGWSEQDTENVESMFRNVFQPVLSKFFQTAPYTNGNWGIAVAKAQLSFGIFLNDRKLYDDAIDFFHHGKDNGSLPNYIAESGQSQEAGRDQQHAMLGVACFADMAEVAWTQGDDLYGALDNRIMKGYEYIAKSNLGYEVPFVTWKDITGKYSNLSVFGKDGMGRFRSIFAYNHYVVRKGLEMPYTKIVLGLVRPEGPGFTCDNTGFGSLLYYLGDDLNAGKDKGRIQEDLTQLKAWTFSTASYRAVNGVMSFVSSGIKLQKRVQYDPSAYPYIVVKAPGIPASANKKWLTLSYSINAAPEFWELDSDKAMKVSEDIYVFKITDFQSNNGYSFSTAPTNITLTLDFGDTCGDPVVVEWIRSFTDAELQSYGYISKDREKIDVEKALKYCSDQVDRTLKELTGGSDVDYTMMPRNIMNDQNSWNLRKATKEEWTAGFWPGVLWYDFEYTKDLKIKKEAEKFTASLEFLSRTPAYDHDLGFLVFCSYGNAYRLTGNSHYKEVILATADTLATLYNPTVGTILSWPREVEPRNWPHNTIMDNMINLDMLFWASKNGGNKKLYDIAVAHADKTMKCHFRPDYTSYHVAVYDTISGDLLKAVTHQGYADNTMWARGQAWAIYGYTVCYRETNDPKYLEFLQKITDVYLKDLPEDYIPYWDFNAPDIPNEPRDASAASIVASALIEASTFFEGEKSIEYWNAAVKMLKTLSSSSYQSGKRNPSFLLHSTGHWPNKSEIDASIIYADYYYIEALIRYRKLYDRKKHILN